MLILTRKPGESIYIGDGIKVTIVEVKGSQIRIGIDAPSEVRIYREEIYEQIREENRQAAEAVSDVGLDSLSAAWGKRQISQTSGIGKLKGMSVKGVVSEGSNFSADASPSTQKPNVTKEPEVFKRRKKRKEP